MKHLLTLSVLLAGATVSSAQDVVITDTTKLSFELFSRPYYRVNYTYPSVAPDGVTPVTLSSAIVFPHDVFERTSKVSVGDEEFDAIGLMLQNRYTMTRFDEAPTVTNEMQIEGAFTAMGPKFIIISPDGFGFGVTVDEPQPYLVADVTSRNSLDAVIAARYLLDQMGYTYGDLMVNVGYSQGGHSSMAVQRYIDTHGTEPEGVSHIDYTLSGAGPYALNAMLDSLTVPGVIYTYPCALGMIAQGQIECAGIDVTYSDIFCPPLDTKIPEWLSPKLLSTGAINDSIFAITGGDVHTGVPIEKVFRMENFTTDNGVLDPYFDALDQNSLTKGWQPNSYTRFYLFHSTEDEVVNYYNTEHMARFLRDECGLGEDRLKVSNALNDHGGAAKYFVVGCIGELLHLEKDYMNGDYVPESFTGLTTVNASAVARHSGWFTLQGHRLPFSPSAPGLYLHNGRKVLIK